MLPTEAKLALCAGGYMTLFFGGAGGSHYLGLAALLVLGFPLLGEPAYTKISLYALLAAFFEEWGFPGARKPFVPFLFVNAFAFASAFEYAQVLDRTAFGRLAAARGESFTEFYAKHLLVHWFPVAVMWLWLKMNKTRYREILPWNPATGIYTAGVHLAWAYANFGTLDLSGVYVYMQKEHWDAMWTVAISNHVAMGMLWRYVI